MSIANPLTEKGKLLNMQYNELFFKGLHPGSLCLYVQCTLHQDSKWPKENRNAPVVEEVMNTAWNEAYIMLVSCIDYALDMTCIQSVSQCFIVGGIL